MKKKQADFQKVKLKVGKHLPKGRNETKTSFQTRKINLREQIKETTGETSLKELLSFMKSSDVKTKYANLRKLHAYVSDNEDTLSMYFPDILKELGTTLQESDAEIRSQAILVLNRCMDILTDVQFKSFADHLISYLNCMMTHMSFQVRLDSLKFLDVLLKSHLSVISQSVEILFYLLNMISHKVSLTTKRGTKNKDLRELSDSIIPKMTINEWRMQVLERILTFLGGLFSENDSKKVIVDDQKKVYWNGKEQLFLPLYLNSGVEPAKFDYSLFSSGNSEDKHSRMKQLIPELICVLSEILKSFSRSGSSSESNIKYLSTVTQILCYVGEWAIQNLDKNDDLTPVQKLIHICDQLLKGFPYYLQAGKSTKKNEVECVLLNLEISYLYCMCSHLTDIPDQTYLIPEKSYFDKWEVIKLFLASVFEVSGAMMSGKAISLSLKICKVLIQCSKLDDAAKNGFLVALLGTLDTNKFSPAANDIYSFFMDLSLDYDYRNFLTTQAMRNWLHSLIKNLSFMMESKNFIPNYLNYITQICARRNPYFMETLRNLPSEKLLEFLKFDNEDFQVTIIHLIVSLDEIFTPEFFQGLAEIMRDKTFSVNIACKLTRMIHSRFSKFGVLPSCQMEFVKFLLNFGCDTALIFDSSLDAEPLPPKQLLLDLQGAFACHWLVYPTIDFDRHNEIFKTCWDCLFYYCKNEMHLGSIGQFIRQILHESNEFPLHSAVAVIEIVERIPELKNDVFAYELLYNFKYSFLVCISWITSEISEDNWIQYCIPTMRECINNVDATKVLAYISGSVDKCITSYPDIILFHSLRILLFLMRKGTLNGVDKNFLYEFLTRMGKDDGFRRHEVLSKMANDIFNNIFRSTNH